MRSTSYGVGAVCLRRLTGSLVLTLMVALGALTPAAAQEMPTRTMYKSTHMRANFDKDIARVAVGDATLLSTETLSDRELLFLGKEVGRSSVIIWFQDGTIEEFTMLIGRDLSTLERLVQDIHPGITVDVAPDREAVVLRGLVPDITYSRAAENAADSYLQAGTKSKGIGEAPLIQGGEDVGIDGAALRVGADTNAAVSAVINLIQLEELPETLVQKLREAIDSVGGEEVDVRRVVRGDVPSDEADAFVFTGNVENQIALTRVLTVAHQVLVGENESSVESIRVIADESGALLGGSSSSGSDAGNILGSGPSVPGSSGSGGSGAALANQIESNIGRAKALELGGGRILSFIEVDDIAQVRVDIRLYEVDRNKLFDFSPATTVVGSDFDQPSLIPPSGAIDLVGEDQAIRTGSQSELDVQGVLSAIAGGLGTEFQLAGKHVALDTAFDLLESKGIARALSRPSLSVLSGEVATFSVGGEVPISQQIFTDVTGGDSSGSVLNEVTFRSFGVELSVRPLVGDDNSITMDITPQISLPDAQLTASIRASTGSDLDSTAFETRYLRTSARLKDGQSLIIAGLQSTTSSESSTYTPWFSQIPLIGWMFKTRSTQSAVLDLVIVVHPVVVRDPLPEAVLWAYPDLRDLLDMARASD